MTRNYQQGKFTPRHPEKYVGDVNNIMARSSWETRVMKWLDGNPSVLNWSSEEIHVPYYDPSTMKNRRYFPDFIVKVRTKSGKEEVIMMEVKPESQSKPPKITKRKKQSTMINEALTWETNKAKWTAAEAYCKKQGWKFVICTESTLGIKV